MKITLKQLRVFDAVASLGSLARAADSLNITPSTASAALKDLQALIDRPPLLTRVGRSLQLTTEGERLQPMVRNLLRQAEEIESPRRDGELSGTVSIGSVEISEDLVPRLAAQFRRHHPEVRVNIVAGTVYEIAALLSRYAIDAMITTSLSRAPGAVLTEIHRERSVICAAPDHPLCALAAPTFADLEGQEWCMPARTSLSNHRAMEALRGHIANFDVAMEINSDPGIREAVRAGCGIACLPYSVVEADIAQGRLVEIPVEGMVRLRPTYLVRMADVERSPAACAFDRFIIDSFASTRRSDEARRPGPGD